MVPGIKIQGQSKRPVTTAKGVLFFPEILTSVLEKKIWFPSASVSPLMLMHKRPFVPAKELFLASVTLPFTSVPRGIAQQSFT